MKNIKTVVMALVAVAFAANAYAQDPLNELKKTYNEAVGLLQAKNYAEALPILEKTVEDAYNVEADEAFAIAEKAQGYIPTCYFRLGLAQVNSDTTAALEKLTKANELAMLYNDGKTSRQAKSAISQVYKVLGAKAFNSKDYASAVGDFAKGYEVNPQDTELGLNLAMSYCELKDYENGVKVYTDIIALGDRHSKFAEPAAEAKERVCTYLLLKAQDENTAGNKEAVYATLDQIILIDALNQTAHTMRLQVAGANKDWDNLIGWGDLAVAAMPTEELQSNAYYLIAVAYDSKDDNATAIATYKMVTAGDNAATAKARIAELEALNK